MSSCGESAAELLSVCPSCFECSAARLFSAGPQSGGGTPARDIGKTAASAVAALMAGALLVSAAAPWRRRAGRHAPAGEVLAAGTDSEGGDAACCPSGRVLHRPGEVVRHFS